MMDQQAAMERMQDLYREKNEHLEKFLELVTPFEFYREIFPVGSFERKGHFEDAKGNGIAVTVPPKAAGIALEIKEEGKAKRYTITDELSELSEVYDTDFTIMSPISYFGRQRCGKNARYLYALVFDLDGVGMPQLRDTLHQMNNDILPQATFVVNSGTGLHLYYVLQEPIPMYPYNQKCLKELKYSLTRQIWNRYTSTIKEPQVQGILQGFRVVGSGSKLGREYPVTAYRLGGRVTLEELREFHDRLYGLYCRDFSGDVPVLHHMRELWNYFSRSFRETDTLLRQVRKAGDCRAYETAVRQFFYDAELSH